MTEAGAPFCALDAVAVAFFPAQATDLSWSVAVARAVELSPAAVAFAVLSSDAAEPAVEFAPFAVDVAVELFDAAEAAFDDDPDAVDVEVEWSTAVDDACDPSPGAEAFAVESRAPELAAAPVGLPTSDVALLRWVAAAVAGPPDVVDVAVDGVVGLSAVPPEACACERVVPAGPFPTEVDPGIGPADAPPPLEEVPPVPALLDAALSAPGAAAAAPEPDEGWRNSGSLPAWIGPALAAAPLLLVFPEPAAPSGPVVVEAVADGGGTGYDGSVGPPDAAAAAAAAGSAGVVAVAGS